MSANRTRVGLATALLLLHSALVNAAVAVPKPLVAQSITGTPGLTIETAALSAGRLSISGTTTRAGTVVKIAKTTFAVRSDTLKRFQFIVTHRTPDCLLTLSGLSHYR